MAYRKTDEDTDALILSAYMGGHSALSIAETIDCSIQTVLNRLREAGIEIRRTNREPVNRLNLVPEHSKRLLEIVDGLLLGDGSIDSTGVLRLEQSIIHKAWVDLVHMMLKEIGVSSAVGWQSPKKSKIGNREICGKGSIFVYTPVSVEIKEQRIRWYPDGKKHIPEDVRLTPLSLALWFCGDGGNKGNGLLQFSTEGFQTEELDCLIQSLNQKFNVCSYKVRSGHTISGRQTFKLVIGRRDDCCLIKNAIEQYVPPVFAYKLRNIQPAVPHGYALRRLVQDQVRQIRLRHSKGETMMTLGRECDVSNVTISNIVHHKIYKDVL